ncbi:WEB family protein At2g17940 [Salvia miltiorrhiza]|uniref:WEB family protein At2g17940 n=1 Tax=Salvia miltiorrhiza TaxID=226208 RepID=UPI0025ACD048|nr:WEB family protein At2g17940 [Salvia miltiorrhiza]
MQREEGVVMRGRVEIDTRQPFRSVREAVMLFGEKVLAGEVYGNKLKEMQDKAKNQPSKLGAVTAELEETKESLIKAKEEGNLMAHCLDSLRQELEQTKKELRQLKTRETLAHILDEPEVEEIKFVENTKNIVEMISTPEKHEEGKIEFQKKRSVKFASPLLTKMMDGINGEGEESKKAKKTKKKPLVPLIGGLFLKKIKKGAKQKGRPRVGG